MDFVAVGSKYGEKVPPVCSFTRDFPHLENGWRLRTAPTGASEKDPSANVLTFLRLMVWLYKLGSAVRGSHIGDERTPFKAD